MSRYDLTDFRWRVIEPLLSNKPRGVPRVGDRHVLNGILWVLRSGAPWRVCRSSMARAPPSTTASIDDDGTMQLIDSTSILAHQQAAMAKEGSRSLSRLVPAMPNDEDTRLSRCAGATDPALPDRRADARYTACSNISACAPSCWRTRHTILIASGN